jgi:hypothetical protein
MWWRNSYSGSLFVGDVLVPESGNVRSMTTVSQWVCIFFFVLMCLNLHSVFKKKRGMEKAPIEL